MKVTKQICLLLVVLIGTSPFAILVLSADKPHGSPATPGLGDTGDWREEYAYTLGVQAAVFTYPWLYFAHLRYDWMAREKPAGYRGIDMPLNQFYHFRNTVDASYRAGGSPNNDTLYSLVFLDVGKEPVILSHPDMADRYFTFEIASMTSDNFAYVGKRTTGGKAGNYLIAGPDWKGKLPEGVQMPAQANGTKMMGVSATSPTPGVFILGRTSVQGKEDAETVNKLQDQYTLTLLSQWGKKKGKMPTTRNIWKPFDPKTDPLAPWKTINRMLSEHPPLAQNKVVVNMFKDIGIGPGLDVENVDDAIKRGLIRAIKSAAPMIKAAGQSAGFGKVINGWSISPNTMGSAGYSGDFLSRGAIQSGAGIVANDPQEAVYPLTRIDASGEVLDSANKYTMTFEPGNLPKVDAFWSLTLYDNTFNLVDNPINRYNITSQTGGYKKSKDGSLTLYIQNESPGKDKEANWLPSPKSGSFFMIFRTYMPSNEIVEQTWQIPGLVKMKGETK